MNTVRVSIKMTSNIPSQTDLFVEVDDISQPAWRQRSSQFAVPRAGVRFGGWNNE